MPVSRSAPESTPSLIKAFWLAARPKTWIASISPVLIGSTLAYKEGFFDLPRFFLTLCFSLFIQIGTNFANDYFDFLKGADTAERQGPKRATQEGWISPRLMWHATCLVFSLALLFATPLMYLAGLWSVALAALCVAFGFLYTGGPKPLGYLGWGEVLVFLFFGPVAAAGTYYLQTQQLTNTIFLASLAPGFLSCSILIANNLRDEQTDRQAEKNTLIVRFGRRFGSWEYACTILAAALVPVVLVLWGRAPVSVLFASLIFPLSLPWIQIAFRFEHPKQLLSVLQGSALILWIYTLLFCFLWLSAPAP